MDKEQKLIAYISIQSNCGRFVLSDNFRDDILYKEPMLCIYEDASQKKEIELWDNEDYLLNLFSALEKRESTKETKELAVFCDENGFNHWEVSEIFVSLFQRAKELQMFKI